MRKPEDMVKARVDPDTALKLRHLAVDERKQIADLVREGIDRVLADRKTADMKGEK